MEIYEHLPLLLIAMKKRRATCFAEEQHVLSARIFLHETHRVAVRLIITPLDTSCCCEADYYSTRHIVLL